jgi:hypothetical protein
VRVRSRFWHASCSGDAHDALAREEPMRTKAIATLRTMMLSTVLLAVALNALPAVAEDSVDCSPPICTSGVARPGSHLDVETR